MTNPPDEIKNTSDFNRAIDSVLLELAVILGEYRNSLVVSGGLAMHLLFGQRPDALFAGDAADIGNFFARDTKDVDLVLNLIQLDRDSDDQKDSISELLMRNLYQQERQYWIKTVRLSGFAGPITIPVEFLAPTGVGAVGNHPLLDKVAELQEVDPAGLDGISLALLQPKEVHISGETPDGTRYTDVPIHVVDPAMLILIKAIAFDDQLKKYAADTANENHLDHAGKHAYDISQLLYRYPGKIPALVTRLIPPYIVVGPERTTVERALKLLRTHFMSWEGQGIRLMIREGELE